MDVSGHQTTISCLKKLKNLHYCNFLKQLKRYFQLLPLLKVRATRGLITSLVILSYIHLAPGII